MAALPAKEWNRRTAITCKTVTVGKEKTPLKKAGFSDEPRGVGSTGTGPIGGSVLT